MSRAGEAGDARCAETRAVSVTNRRPGVDVYADDATIFLSGRPRRVIGLTRWVLRHRRLVVLGWALLTLAGVAAASQISGALSQSSSAPGREGFDTNAAIVERFGAGGAVPPIVLVADGADRDAAASAFAAVAREVSGSRLAVVPEGTPAALLFVPPGPGGADENPAALAAARPQQRVPRPAAGRFR